MTEEVYQEFIGEDFKVDEHPEKVAIFTSREKAQDYIDKARLKQPIKQSFSGTRSFKEKSVLAGAAYAEIEQYRDLPINPWI